MKRYMIAGAVTALAFGFSGVVGGQDSGAQGNIDGQVMSRPRLGVSVDLNRTDSIGVYIQKVAPGSPAEQAGIRPGDFITKIDGQPIILPDDPQNPGLRLIRLATRLPPGVTVPVELRRGHAHKTVSVTTAPDVELALSKSMSESVGKWTFRVQLGDSEAAVPKRFFMFVTSPWAELDVVSLESNRDLAEYFGTMDGVLILRVPSDSKLGLKGGDIVLSVSGKKPTTPANFLRIVQDHNENDPIKLTVLRHGKRLAITVRPDSGQR